MITPIIDMPTSNAPAKVWEDWKKELESMELPPRVKRKAMRQAELALNLKQGINSAKTTGVHDGK